MRIALPSLLFLGLLVAFVPFAMVASTGCGGAQQTPEQRFSEQLNAFHGHMRWGRWEDAANFVTESKRFDFLGEHEEIGDDYEVTEYEIRAVNMLSTEKRARVTVWVQSFRLPSTVVREETWIEEWAWNDDRRVWELEERRLRDDRRQREQRQREFQQQMDRERDEQRGPYLR